MSFQLENEQQTISPKKKLKVRKLLIFLICLQLFLIPSITLLRMHFYAQRQMNALEAQKIVLLKEQEQLTKTKENLDNPQMIEQLVRDKLGLVRKGEIIIESNIQHP